MASLKDLRLRITSVQSTKKITSAMKMVAASKLRRAQDAAEQARPYAQRMESMLGNLAGGAVGQAGAPPLLAGTGKDDSHLVVVMRRLQHQHYSQCPRAHPRFAGAR